MDSPVYTECNWEVWTKFGHEIQVPKQDNMSLPTRVRSYSGKNAVHAWWCCTWCPTCRRAHWMASTLTWLESSGFLPVGTPKSLLYATPVDNEETFHHRTVDACEESLYGCGGPWWDVSRRALNLTEDILSTYYKCTLSALIHKLNVSRHILIWTFFLVFLCGIRAQNLSATFSYTLYIPLENCSF
jgi:hypothetical protein